MVWFKTVTRELRNYLGKYLCKKIQQIINVRYSELNTVFDRKNITGFWNKISQRHRPKVVSSLGAQPFGNFYSGVMSDDHSDLNSDQISVRIFVQNKFEVQLNMKLSAKRVLVGSYCL